MNAAKKVWKFDHRDVARLKAMPRVTKEAIQPNRFGKNESHLRLFTTICSWTKLLLAALPRLRPRSPLEETAMSQDLSPDLAGASSALLTSGSDPNYLPYCLRHHHG